MAVQRVLDSKRGFLFIFRDSIDAVMIVAGPLQATNIKRHLNTTTQVFFLSQLSRSSFVEL